MGLGFERSHFERALVFVVREGAIAAIMQSSFKSYFTVMDISNLTPEQKKAILANTSFPYNDLELMTKYRGKSLVVVDDKFLGILGEIDFKAIQKYYRAQGKEPVIVGIPLY